MRTVFLCWAFGFVGLATLSGCEALQRHRDRPAEAKCGAAPNLPSESDAAWPTVAAKPEAILPPPIVESIPQDKTELPDVTVLPEIPRNVDLPPVTESAVPAKEPVIENLEVKNPRTSVKEPVFENIEVTRPKAPVKEPVVENLEIKSPKAPVQEPVTQKIEVKNTNLKAGEAGKFQSVVGQVQQFRKTWRLRYAPLDQDDPYGGSVVLEGASLDRLRDGQRVRVQGLLIPPTDRTSPARYRVQTIEVVE